MKTLPLRLLALTCMLMLCGACASDHGKKVAPEPPVPRLERINTLRGSHVNSPKSVIFSKNGNCFYVNSLEGFETVVYDAITQKQIAVIRHEFNSNCANLFLKGENTAFDYKYYTKIPEDKRNFFTGKPVESALTHNGRYLWVSYYRRSFDCFANSPSAVAVIDTLSQAIVRVIPTGPLPKILVPSHDGSLMAIVHWGDNSIGLMDIKSPNPADFRYVRLLVDEPRLSVTDLSGDRDAVCGWYLRGAAFSADDRWLFVGRTSGGGITVFDMKSMERLGTFEGVPLTPRHLVLSRNGKKLYVSSNYSGTIAELDVEELIKCVQKGATVAAGMRSLKVGSGARTLVQSPDEKFLLVACNMSQEVVLVDIEKWKVVDTASASPYPVGLAINPAGDLVVSTSQSFAGNGGQAVDVYRVIPPIGPAVSPANKPLAQDTTISENSPDTAKMPAKPSTTPLPPKRGQDSAYD